MRNAFVCCRTVWLPVIQHFWTNERLPEIWNEGILVKIAKKGDARDCNNCRGITLLPIPSKILAQILLDRIFHEVTKTLRENDSEKTDRALT